MLHRAGHVVLRFRMLMDLSSFGCMGVWEPGALVRQINTALGAGLIWPSGFFRKLLSLCPISLPTVLAMQKVLICRVSAYIIGLRNKERWREGARPTS